METDNTVDLKTLTRELGLTRRQLVGRMDQFIKSSLLIPGKDFYREYRGAPLPLEDYERLKQFSVIKVNRDRMLHLLKADGSLPCSFEESVNGSDQKVDHSVNEPLTTVNRSGDAVNHGQPATEPSSPMVSALERENEMLREIVAETRKERDDYKQRSDDSSKKLEEKNDQIMGWMHQVIRLKDQVLQLTSGNREDPSTEVYSPVHEVEDSVNHDVNDGFTDVNESVNGDTYSNPNAFEHANMPESVHTAPLHDSFPGGQHARKLEVKSEKEQGSEAVGDIQKTDHHAESY